LRPKYAEGYHLRGKAHTKKGNHAAALKDLTEAIRWRPNSAKLYAERAEIHRNLGDDKAAKEDDRIAEKLRKRSA
jgi:Flp pilus assembly protein TadD